MALRQDAYGEWVTSTLTNKDISTAPKWTPDDTRRVKGLVSVLTFTQVGHALVRVASGATTRKAEALRYGVNRHTMQRIMGVYLNEGKAGFKII